MLLVHIHRFVQISTQSNFRIHHSKKETLNPITPAKKKNPYPMAITPQRPLPWPLATANLLSVPIYLPILDFHINGLSHKMWCFVAGFFHLT